MSLELYMKRYIISEGIEKFNAWNHLLYILTQGCMHISVSPYPHFNFDSNFNLNCRNCKGCMFCYECDDCVNCQFCSFLDGCVDCKVCRNCIESLKCWYCIRSDYSKDCLGVGFENNVLNVVNFGEPSE